MKRMIPVIMTPVIILALCLGCQSTRQTPTLATAGKTVACITLADTASLPEKNAANELAAYLKKVTGAEFAIVRPGDAAGRPVIAVGPGAVKAVAPDMDLAKAGDRGLGDDGIVLKTIPPHLALTGAEGSKRGTLYAVYEFLEREVGVRWWTHTEEFVPGKPTLAVRPLDIRYKPQFIYREVFSWGMVHKQNSWGYDDSDAAVKDWGKAKFAARLRNNGFGTAMPASLGGCIMPLGWAHTFYPFLPPDKYFKDHPDWYSEINGKRTGDNAQLCMTNDEMLRELAKNVLAKIREQPHLGMVSLTQNDWYGNCQCAKCKVLDDAEGSPSASLLYGVNKVAEAVEKEFPEFYVETFAYQYTRKPPKTLRPRLNVLICLGMIERSATQPIDSDENRALMDDLKGWLAAVPNLFIWDYTMNLSCPMAPHPNWQVFGPDFRTYRDHRAIGVFCESESIGVTDFVALKVYLMAHLLWDPSRDERAITDEFLNGYYGKAGSALRQVLDLFATKGRQLPMYWYEGPDANWLDLAEMNRATELFQQAEAAVTNDPAALARVKRARISLDHQWLYGYWLYRDQAEREGIAFRGPQDPAKAAADFSAYVRAEIAAMPPDFMTENVSYYMKKSYDAYLDGLAKSAVAVMKSGPLPACFRDIPRSKIIDIEEWRASISESAGAKIVDDAKAVNGLAMLVPKAPAPSWAVQAKTKLFGILGGGFGRYHVYAVIRCEFKADTGAAFVGGVWDYRNRNGLGAISFPIGKPAPPLSPKEIDANPEVTFATITSGTPVTDGEYHVYDFGVYDLAHNEIAVWVGTTTSDIYVDRFVFVRAP